MTTTQHKIEEIVDDLFPKLVSRAHYDKPLLREALKSYGEHCKQEEREVLRKEFHRKFVKSNIMTKTGRFKQVAVAGVSEWFDRKIKNTPNK